MSHPIRILFQGDSITDAGRNRENERALGTGYPNLVAAELGFDAPGACLFLNRAISGNRVVDLYARWKIDAINLAPDVISILIGINDVWHEVSRQNGVEAARFEQIYDLLLSLTRERLPQAKLMLLEPFVLKSSATEAAWDYFQSETALRAQAVRRLAQRYGAVLVPLQEKFDAAVRLAPAEHWLQDGVHPTPAGHELIQREWIRTFKEMGGIESWKE